MNDYSNYSFNKYKYKQICHIINSHSIQTYYDNNKLILIKYIFIITEIITNVCIIPLCWCQGLANLLAIAAKCEENIVNPIRID